MRPYFTVVAGPNGSGKSTLTSSNAELFAGIPILDPDAIAKMIANQYEGDSALEAGRRVLVQVEEYLERRQSFSVETTLSGKWVLSAMRKARERGFIVGLVFVGIDSPDINVQRVHRRVGFGGHDVPEADIRRRYIRSFSHLPTAIQLSEQAVLFDNSSSFGYQMIGHLLEGEFWWSGFLPAWAETLRQQLLRERRPSELS